MRAVWFVLVAGCYQNPATESACKVRCTDACPSGTSCVNGFCVGPGQTCMDDGGIFGDGGPIEKCAVEVAVGRRHLCMRKPDNTVWCSGERDNNQLGNGGAGGPVATPVQVLDASGPITDATAIGAGRSTTCAIRTGGELWCWGKNSDAEAGVGDYNAASLARRVVVSGGAPLANIVQVEGGQNFTCARDSTNGVWCWGSGNNGRLGDNSGAGRPYAARVLTASLAPINDAVELSVGSEHACVRTQADGVSCWGRNDSGQIGNGTQTDAYTATPVTTAGAVAAGQFHTCAVNPDTTITCWGDAWHNRLGDGEPFDRDTAPTDRVLEAQGGAAFVGATGIGVGGVSCAIADGGRVVCWGNSTHGQAGVGGLFPRAITLADGTPLTDATKLVVKNAHACAHRSDGYILCWGRNLGGELGDGTFVNTATAEPLRLSCN